MRVAPTTLAVALSTEAAFTLQPSARAEPAATRIVDRTIVCSVGVRAGIRKIEIHARTGTRLLEDRSKWKFRASATVFDPSPRRLTFGWVTAGWPPPRRPGVTPSADSLALAPQCRSSHATVPLTTTGLTGGAASPLDDEYHCVVPRTILVRVKGIFRSPTALRFERRWVQLTAKGVLKEGHLAVQTPSGTPVVYAKVLESERSSLFVGKICEPDLISTDG